MHVTGLIPLNVEVSLPMTENLAKMCVVAGVTAVLGLAQPPGGRPGGGPSADPQAMIKMRVDFLGAQLGLTDSQKDQAAGIFTAAYTASQSIRSELQTNRQSLSDAVKKNDTASIERLAAASGILNGQITAIDSKAEAAFYALLTVEQQAKYDSAPRAGPGGPAGPGAFGSGRFGGPRRQ
jgi:Spy/CpxP family protein refolding chaperone